MGYLDMYWECMRLKSLKLQLSFFGDFYVFWFFDFYNKSIIEIKKKQMNPTFYIIIKPPEQTKPCQNFFMLEGHCRAQWLQFWLFDYFLIFFDYAKFQKDWTTFILDILQWSPLWIFGESQKQKTSKGGPL